MSSQLPLEDILAAVNDAFINSKAWTDQGVQVRQRYKQVNKMPVAQGPRTKLPPDPFSAHCVVPEPPLGESANTRCYKPLGHALARHAKTYGAAGPEGLSLSIHSEEGLAPHTIKVTVTEI